MSTLLEDRLAAALQARAAQVAPEDLRPLEVPETTRRPWRPVLAGLAAAAAVVAVAVPLVTEGPDDDRPAPPVTSPSPSPSAVAGPFTETSRARGDVDGDGAADLVRTDAEGLVRVDLADGSSAELQQPPGAGVDGLAEVGTPGLAIVLGIDSGDERPAHVLRWVDGQLEEVRTLGDAWLGTRAGETFWVEDHVLYTGSFEGTFGGEPVSVAVRAWEVRGGLLQSNAMGKRCWQPSEKEPHPVSCSASGSAFDVGPRGDLHALLPALEEMPVGQRFHWEFAQPGEYAQLQGKLGPAEFARAGQVELVVLYHGREYRAPLPAGASPALLPAALSGIDGDTPVLLVRQSSGDAAFMTVFSIRDDDRLKQVEPVGDVFLGSGFVDRDGTLAEQRTWLTPDGQLFTAVRLDQGTGRHQLWRWNDNMGDTITPTDFGVVCIDWETDDYGRCP
jgi:hypothetical protein